MNSNIRVHVAAVGFEINRVTDPIISERADKVYLITNSSNDKGLYYLSQIKSILDKKGFLEINILGTNIWDLYECIKTYKQIIDKEKTSHIYINVSTGSKISSIAGTLVCMIWKGIPYYVSVDYENINIDIYKISNEKTTGIIELPVYSVNKPRSDSLLILDILKNNKGKIRKKSLIDKLENYRIIDQNLSIAAKHSKLKSLLNPLSTNLENPLVEVEYKGRLSNVMLTQQGENTLKIFS